MEAVEDDDRGSPVRDESSKFVVVGFGSSENGDLDCRVNVERWNQAFEMFFKFCFLQGSQ